MVVLRSADGSNREHTLKRFAEVHAVRVPVAHWRPVKFNRTHFEHNPVRFTFRDYRRMPYTNVQGLPVYQEQA